MEIELGHGIYDHLPRGSDGDKLAEAITDRIAVMLAAERKAIADAARLRATCGTLPFSALEAIIESRSAGASALSASGDAGV